MTLPSNPGSCAVTRSWRRSSAPTDRSGPAGRPRWRRVARAFGRLTSGNPPAHARLKKTVLRRRSTMPGDPRCSRAPIAYRSAFRRWRSAAPAPANNADSRSPGIHAATHRHCIKLRIVLASEVGSGRSRVAAASVGAACDSRAVLREPAKKKSAGMPADQAFANALYERPDCGRIVLQSRVAPCRRASGRRQ